MKLLANTLVCILLVICSQGAFSQDIIILKTGDEITAKVEEIKPDVVSYRKFENLQGPLYTIEKNKIFMIKYANGSKDVFTEQSETPTPQQHVQTTPQPAPVQSVPKPTIAELPVTLEYWNGGKIRKNNITLSLTQVKDIMRPYPEAFSLYTSGRSLKITGDVFEAVGYVFVISALVNSLNENQDTGRVSAGFAVASLGTSIVLELIGKSNIKKSVRTYNAAIKPTSHLYISPGGIGYCVRF
ncbi:MAG: hypothetical protein BWY22_00348 [Bacteroidetes bacterium ADurb.Bin217]|nr:MAG: hypothetical protein BWY22_00348 [Bacteroidetes bacterium ADurb.Bin217]